MKLINKLQITRYESDPGSRTVFILFEQPEVNSIFAELIKSRGFQARIARDIDEIDPDSKVISEAHFFFHLSRSSQEKCLVVGESNAVRDLAPVCLTQPLTEEKVEIALEEFFKL